MIRLMPGSMLPGRMAASFSKLVLAQVALGDPDVSTDGSHAVYTRRITRSNGYRRHIWVVPLDGGRPRALTAGDVRDSSPHFAGDRVLFLRDDQVWAVPLAGGDAEKLTALAHGVSAFVPSPDGARLALCASAPETRFAVGPLKSDVHPLARVIARADWRRDGQRYRDRHVHLYVQPARAGARARRITHGDWSVDDVAWSPDGKRIAFCADLGADSDFRGAPAVHVVDANGGEVRELARLAGSCEAPSWSRTASMWPSSAPTRQASRSDASSRCGSCRPRAGRRAISRRATICTSRSRTGRISSTGRSTQAVGRRGATAP